MKIKKFAKSMAAVILGATMSFSAFAFVGCGDTPDNPTPPPTEDDPIINIIDAKVKVTLDKAEINAGSNETVTATAEVSELEDKTVTWSLEGEGAKYAEIDSDTGVITLIQGLSPFLDQAVTVVATSTVSASVKGSATFVIKAQVIEGQVGLLTTEMFTELGNSKITVLGEVSDIYKHFTDDSKSNTNKYDYKVTMADNSAWYGEWNAQGSKDKEMNNYRRSEKLISGTDKHTLNQVYINKDNEVAQKVVTDYNSREAVWEEQHLWNHLAQLAQDIESQWEYDAVTRTHSYKFNNSDIDDMYLRLYLAISLTPMLGEYETDMLESIVISADDIVDGKITRLTASTSVIYYGASEEGTSKDATAMSYTLFTANFTEVGTTSVSDPTPFTAPQRADKLEKALASMGDATNYTFNAVETTLSAPTPDEGDYAQASISTYGVSNGTSSTGTEGIKGQITADAILLARTGKYTSSMDDKLYHTEYSGYKKIDSETYDYFEYDASLKKLVGKRQYKGDIFDNMPKFEFSANIFKYDGMSEIKVGDDEFLPIYNFILRDPAVTRDVAMQVSAHNYATDAAGSTYGTFKISVTEDGRVYSTEFPYSLVSGTYRGIVKTTYSKVGTTTLEEDTFADYQPRVVRDNWNKFDVRYYYPNHSTQDIAQPIDAGTLFTNIFGAEAKNLPSPLAFYNAFGDSMTDAFFEWEEEDNTATGGDKIYHEFVSMNVSIDECDENYVVSKEIHDKYISKLTQELAKYGFQLSAANTAETYYGDRYTTYINGNIMIKIHNNRSRYFFIDILPVGLWTYDPSNSVAPNN